jgi:glycosyltransferase involved in cell wall biosynthesis
MSRPHVLLDLERLRSPHTGLAHVCQNLADHLIQQGKSRFRFSFLVPPGLSDVQRARLEGHELSEATLMRSLLPGLLPACDLYHATHQDSNYIPSRGKVLLTIHDLNFLGEKSPEKAKKRLARIQRKVDRAAAISVISSFTGQVVREHLNIDPKKPFEVIHNGVSMNLPKHLDRPANAPQKPFLFAIGVVRPKKNFLTLVEMLPHVANLDLVIAGDMNHDYANKLKARVAALGLEERVHLPGVVSTNDRFWYYQNCEALTFPSLFEGFGLPPVEAMRLGKPVFLSQETSLPEVGGEEAYFWENFEPKHMGRLVSEGLEEVKQQGEAKAQRLKAWSNRFTWETSAEAYMRLYERVLDTP